MHAMYITCSYYKGDTNMGILHITIVWIGVAAHVCQMPKNEIIRNQNESHPTDITII